MLPYSNYFGDLRDFLLQIQGFIRGILYDLISECVLLPYSLVFDFIMSSSDSS